jgi:hypothetical protein
MHFLHFPLCYLSVLSHDSNFNCPVNIWLTIQIRKLFIVKISPSSCYFHSLKFTYCHQHPVLPDNLSLCSSNRVKDQFTYMHIDFLVYSSQFLECRSQCIVYCNNTKLNCPYWPFPSCWCKMPCQHQDHCRHMTALSRAVWWVSHLSGSNHWYKARSTYLWTQITTHGGHHSQYMTSPDTNRYMTEHNM